MSQKIDILGMFIDPEQIQELALQNRFAVYVPFFEEVSSSTVTTGTIFKRQITNPKRKLRYVNTRAYGIELAPNEQPSSSEFVVDYKTAVIERAIKSFGKIGKNTMGKINDMVLKIDTTGDREVRLLLPGRRVIATTIREIPAKAKLLSGQIVDVMKNNPEYEFLDGTPYATTNVEAKALFVRIGENKNHAQTYVLFGGGIDASDEQIINAYLTLTTLYNDIRNQKASPKLNSGEAKPNILQKVQLPKFNLPVKIQSPLVFAKKPQVKESETESISNTDAKEWS